MKSSRLRLAGVVCRRRLCSLASATHCAAEMASPDSLERQAKIETGPLLPLLPPKPLTRSLPPLPPRPANATPIHAGWTCERVVFPAAFPRSYAGSTKRPDEPKTNPADPAPGAKRANPKEALVKLLHPQLDGFQRRVQLDDKGELAKQEQLVVAANRYRPERQRTDNGPGLTLVFSHANGFYKGERGHYILPTWS